MSHLLLLAMCGRVHFDLLHGGSKIKHRGQKLKCSKTESSDFFFLLQHQRSDVRFWSLGTEAHNTTKSSGQFAVGHQCHSGFKSMSLCRCSTRNTTSEVRDAALNELLYIRTWASYVCILTRFKDRKEIRIQNRQIQRVMCFKKLLMVNTKVFFPSIHFLSLRPTWILYPQVIALD